MDIYVILLYKITYYLNNLRIAFIKSKLNLIG